MCQHFLTSPPLPVTALWSVTLESQILSSSLIEYINGVVIIADPALLLLCTPPLEEYVGFDVTPLSISAPELFGQS